MLALVAAKSGTGLTRAGAQTLDRVVASIGETAITRSDVEREYALEAVIDDGRLPKMPPDAAALVRVRDRLIDQELLALEAQSASEKPANVKKVAAERLAGIRRKCSSQEALDSDLRSLGMDEYQLLGVLEGQERTLEMINQRLRPAASPDRSEIQAYYRNQFAPEYAKRGQGAAPPLAEVESQIREILTQQKIDEQLTAWLRELRQTRHVKVHPF
ncbi:MAG TPA: hypothetical protein VG204_09540 [Terriglobia bacterium]|nr:hypothetical protein [Terriglobia bacterium]